MDDIEMAKLKDSRDALVREILRLEDRMTEEPDAYVRMQMKLQVTNHRKRLRTTKHQIEVWD